MGSARCGCGTRGGPHSGRGDSRVGAARVGAGGAHGGGASPGFGDSPRGSWGGRRGRPERGTRGHSREGGLGRWPRSVPTATRDRGAVRGAGAGAVRGASLGVGWLLRHQGVPCVCVPLPPSIPPSVGCQRPHGWGGARVAVPGCGGTIWHPPCLRCRLRRGSRRAKYHKLERQTLAGSGGRRGRHGADSGAAIRSLSPPPNWVSPLP